MKKLAISKVFQNIIFWLINVDKQNQAPLNPGACFQFLKGDSKRLESYAWIWNGIFELTYTLAQLLVIYVYQRNDNCFSKHWEVNFGAS